MCCFLEEKQKKVDDMLLSAIFQSVFMYIKKWKKGLWTKKETDIIFLYCI